MKDLERSAVGAPAEPHYRIQQVAEILRHSQQWVQQRIQRGELSHFRWGPRDVTVSASQIKSFAARWSTELGKADEGAPSAG